eukprot:TRINITY_DN34462_c0_g1_i1.p1 TRINITY_DN34462_c0_g1~~TRINITY_DN34462_c0_g1_i1.p1  ORF type:complete len:101 (-),score=17.21 TRINITY_DN34462_c0_g1_i1:7-309(-)
MRCLVRLLLSLQSLVIITAGISLLTVGGIYGAEKFGDWDGGELGFAAAIACGLGAALCVLGLLGVLTSCSKSYSWSYCFSILCSSYHIPVPWWGSWSSSL